MTVRQPVSSYCLSYLEFLRTLLKMSLQGKFSYCLLLAWVFIVPSLNGDNLALVSWLTGLTSCGRSLYLYIVWRAFLGPGGILLNRLVKPGIKDDFEKCSHIFICTCEHISLSLSPFLLWNINVKRKFVMKTWSTIVLW